MQSPAASAAFTVWPTVTGVATSYAQRGSGRTVSVNVFADVAAAASVTVTVKTCVAIGSYGIPPTSPVLVQKNICVGSAWPLNANLYGGVPPLAVTGVNSGIHVFVVPVVLGTACVAISALFTVSVNVFADVAAAASVTVTVKTVAASVVVGVPLTAPVLVLKPIPVGSVPPLNANVYGSVPPLAVTGVNVAISAFTVPVVLGTACVVVSPPTAMIAKAELVAPVRPVAVAVSV
jgi:hypothetical protein